MSQSGVSKVEFKESTEAWGGTIYDLGVPRSGSPGFTPENNESEQSNGQMNFAGQSRDVTFQFEDFTDYAAIKALMEANTECDLRITLLDGTTKELAMNSLPKVKPNYGAATGDNNYWELNMKAHSLTGVS